MTKEDQYITITLSYYNRLKADSNFLFEFRNFNLDTWQDRYIDHYEDQNSWKEIDWEKADADD